jgi:hypothetical protein
LIVTLFAGLLTVHYNIIQLIKTSKPKILPQAFFTCLRLFILACIFKSTFVKICQNRARKFEIGTQARNTDGTLGATRKQALFFCRGSSFFNKG